MGDMTSLAEVYEGHVGEGASLRRLYAGTALFVGGEEEHLKAVIGEPDFERERVGGLGEAKAPFQGVVADVLSVEGSDEFLPEFDPWAVLVRPNASDRPIEIIDAVLEGEPELVG
jgi:hypothetical protein